jgi:arsenate reductase (thioredoxin)
MNRAVVLFLCTANACRSQMAEGWLRHLHGDRLEALSAGTRPGELDARAVRVMAEAGVDISRQRSKTLVDQESRRIDLLVTVCDRARESCPVFPGVARSLHRSFADPPELAATTSDEEAALDVYRRVRDEIRDFVVTLPDLLSVTGEEHD